MTSNLPTNLYHVPLKNIFLWFDFLYNVISCGDTDLEWEDHRREVMDLSLTVQVTAVHLRLELSVPGLHRTESLQGTAEAWLHVRHYRLQLEPIKNNFNSLASGRCGRNFKSIIFKLIIHSSSLGTVKLLSGERHRNSLVGSRHWFRYWLGVIRHQAITWANVDPNLCRHIPSLGHNEWVGD